MRGRHVTFVALSLGLALLVGCGAEPAPPGESAAPPRHVVLVVIDSLRADHLGSYGYARATSPRLDALAAEGIRFEQALAPSPWTLPSLATLMTSLPPSIHGAASPSDLGDLNWLFDPAKYRPVTTLHDSRLTLAEILSQAGFATAGFVQGSYPSRVFGFEQGFDRYDDNATPGIRFDVENALAWLDDEEPERFFVYLHTIEVHSPYAPLEIQPYFEARAPDAPMEYFERAVPEERRRFEAIDFDPGYQGPVDGSWQSLAAIAGRGRISKRDREHLVALYDRGIAYTDYWVGQLLDGLAERGLANDTLVVVTSDHGEEFLEHGRLEHSYSFYEEMLRVPLILRVPGEGGASVVSQPAGLVDLLPTLLDVLDVQVEVATEGRSLRPLWQGTSLEAREHVGEASFLADTRALRTPRWKYIRAAGGVDELYDLERDPQERKNVCAGESDRCAALRERLAALEAERRERAAVLALPAAEPAVLDDPMKEQLEALGYAEPETPPPPKASDAAE